MNYRCREGRVLYVLLAGGRSRRFGQDKRRVLFQGKLLWNHALEKLQVLGGGWVLVEPGCRLAVPPGVVRLEDPEPYAGPAVALAQALKKMQHARPVVVFPVDMPLLPVSFLLNLGKMVWTKPVWVVDPEHPLPMGLAPKGVASLLHAVADGTDAFQTWLASLPPGTVGVMKGIPRVWLHNVNRPEDLERIPFPCRAGG